MRDHKLNFELMNNEKFIVTVSVKPYIKKFIENNCGEPADIKMLPAIHTYMVTLLCKPSKRFERRINNNLYSDQVDIAISEDEFNRYGWELTKTDTVKFNQRIEGLIKISSRLFISNNKKLGVPVARSIKEFQCLFDFSEDDFPYETIKKDFVRHGPKIENKTKILMDFKQELQIIFLEHLSDLGTISPLFKKEKCKALAS